MNAKKPLKLPDAENTVYIIILVPTDGNVESVEIDKMNYDGVKDQIKERRQVGQIAD